MKLLFQLALRNVRRQRRRAALTAATIAIGTALMTAGLAWLQGVVGSLVANGAVAMGHVRIAVPDYLDREDLFPLYEHIGDADAVAQQLEQLDGIDGVYTRLTAPAVVTADEEVGDVFGLVVGASERWYRDRMDLQGHLKDGTVHGEEPDDVVLGAVVAETLRAGVGDEIVVLGQTQDGALSPIAGNVVGIVEAGNAIWDQGVFLTMHQARWMADIDGGATELLAYGSDRDRVNALRTQVIDALTTDDAHAESWADHLAHEDCGAAYVVQGWNEQVPLAGFIRVMDFLRRWVAGAIVFVTALAVWNTMTMSVLERTREIGVLRAMGMTRVGTVTLLVVEASSIALVGGLLGVALGGMGGVFLETYGIDIGSNLTQNTLLPSDRTIYADMEWSVAVATFLLGMVTALLGTIAPAWYAAWISPVEAMREQR